VIIICPKHGEFEQIPSSHLKGHECVECGHEKTKKSLLKNKEIFISEAKNIHGEKYEYYSVKYLGSRKKVTIICPKHGEFEQIPDSHLRGRGCPKCVNRQTTTEDFIENNIV
jgi:Zn ribbon nucleic-acid-binding protein